MYEECAIIAPVEVLVVNSLSWVTHICISKIIIIGSYNGLLPGRHQAIIQTNAGILLIGPLGINFSEISVKLNTFSFKKMHLKMLSAKQRLFRLSHNELTVEGGRIGDYKVRHTVKTLI